VSAFPGAPGPLAPAGPAPRSPSRQVPMHCPALCAPLSRRRLRVGGRTTATDGRFSQPVPLASDGRPVTSFLGSSSTAGGGTRPFFIGPYSRRSPQSLVVARTRRGKPAPWPETRRVPGRQSRPGISAGRSSRPPVVQPARYYPVLGGAFRGARPLSVVALNRPPRHPDETAHAQSSIRFACGDYIGHLHVRNKPGDKPGLTTSVKGKTAH